MPLIIGSRSYDLSTRVLVVAVISVDTPTPAAEVAGRAEGLAAEGADILELVGEDVEAVRGAVNAVQAAVDTPLAAASRHDAVARAAVAAGVVLTASPEVALETGTSLVADGISVAMAANREGVGGDRIVVDVSPRLRPHSENLVLGYPLLASTGVGPHERALAAASLAVSTGCRLVRTNDARGVRRVCDVLRAVLEARVAAAGAPT